MRETSLTVTSLTPVRMPLSGARGRVEPMRVNLPGQPEHRPTSLVSPLVQLGVAAALFVVALAAYLYAPQARATDVWLYNALSAVTGLAGLLFLPFAVASLFTVLRNRRVT